jgi:hypothetical protein
LTSCFAGLDGADVIGVTVVDVVLIGDAPAAGWILLPTIDAFATEAFNDPVDGSAALTTAGGGGMDRESSEDDASAFTIADGISTSDEVSLSSSSSHVFGSSLSTAVVVVSSLSSIFIFTEAPSLTLFSVSAPLRCVSLDTSCEEIMSLLLIIVLMIT